MSTATLEPALLTIPEAASFLGIGRSKLYELMADGELTVVRIGKAVRLPTAELRRWVAAQVQSSSQQ